VNVKEYISSGIIESYVLGLVSDAERNDFEAKCGQFEEIASARNAFELSLEQQMLRDAVQPPAKLKSQILERISTIRPDTEKTYEEQSSAPVRQMNTWRWLAAASFILLAGAALWALTSQRTVNNLEARNRELQQQLQASNTQLAQLNSDAAALHNPGLKMAALKGTAQAPQALATIFWDTASTSHDVYLMVNNLPQPATNQQYQLWALLDGQPIDLGVFDMDVRQTKLLVKMKNVQSAQAFAITLEPKGGSQQPTMTSMYVMGNL
jgi:anti-sigma-K factor RskA